MPLKRNNNTYDVYERIMARMAERLDLFVDQFANRMNDMMNPRRCGDRNEWENDRVADDDYDEGPVFDDDPYKEEIVSRDVGVIKDELEMRDDVFVLIGEEVAEGSEIPEAMFPLHEAFSDVYPNELCPGEHEELRRKVEEFISNGHIRKIISTCAQPRGPLDLMSFHVSGSVPKKVQDFIEGLPYHGDSSDDDLVANQITKIEKTFKEIPQGALPSNNIPNPREDIKVITILSGITLDGPSVSSPKLNKDKLQDKSDIQIHKFLQMFKKLHFNISFAEALAQMPKYAKMLKDLLTNKEKLIKLANTPLNENCSAVLLKKLPEKLKDPGKFLIPCDFSELELANRSVAYPVGIAEEVFVQVGKFTFHDDFIVVDYDVYPRVPLILGRPFLRTAHALVDVYGEELTLKVERLKADNMVRVNRIVIIFLIESSIHILDQNRYPVDTSLIHLESRNSPTTELFDVDSGRISIHHCEY
nr:hypothetical protein [Tanacetum cinerariifolium]